MIIRNAIIWRTSDGSVIPLVTECFGTRSTDGSRQLCSRMQQHSEAPSSWLQRAPRAALSAGRVRRPG